MKKTALQIGLEYIPFIEGHIDEEEYHVGIGIELNHPWTKLTEQKLKQFLKSKGSHMSWTMSPEKAQDIYNIDISDEADLCLFVGFETGVGYKNDIEQWKLKIANLSTNQTIMEKLTISKLEYKKEGIVSEVWTILSGWLGGRFFVYMKIDPVHPWYGHSLKEINPLIEGDFINNIKNAPLRSLHSYLPEDNCKWLGAYFIPDVNLVCPEKEVEEEAIDFIKKACLVALEVQLKVYKKPKESFKRRRKLSPTTLAVHEMMDENPDMLLASNDGDLTLYYLRKTILLAHAVTKKNISPNVERALEEIILQAYKDQKEYLDS